MAGKGWRGIHDLRAKVGCNPKTREATISIPALTVTADDAPNFPSKASTIALRLKDGRLAEITPGKSKPRY